MRALAKSKLSAVAFVAIGTFRSALSFLQPSSILVQKQARAFQTSPNSRVFRPFHMFFADTIENESSNVQVTSLDGSETSIFNAAKFMVDSFWMQSPQQLVQARNDDSPIPDSVKSSLTNIQADDLMGKYGERLGKRKLDALVLAASEDGVIGNELSNTDNILGMVTIEVRLLDSESKDILNAEMSEKMLTQAVASLGPKQRREYKDRSVIDIATELLPPEISAVCSLSNLCVAPTARRKGVAAKLCREAEDMAKNKLGFNEMFLRVEAGNEAAVKLYETKLGYERLFEVDSTTALRVDGSTGSFVEIAADIVVMKKIL